MAERRLLIRLWRIALLVAFLLWLYPIGRSSTRIAFVACLIGVWSGVLLLWRERPWVRVGCFGVFVSVAATALLPGRPANPENLRERFLRALTTYEGTAYVWGGENHLGIDCSGLVRRGLIDAELKEGVLSFNPVLVRQSFALRWNDCSAQALLDGHRSQTRRLLEAGNIHQLDYTLIRPGDFAVTADGVHVLAYLGDETWIEADPEIGKVVRVHASGDNKWLFASVVILRWRSLE